MALDSDCENNNVNVTVDYVFRNIKSLEMRTDPATGVERLFFVHEPSGFSSRVIFTPLNQAHSAYTMRLTARLDRGSVKSKERVSMTLEERFKYACQRLKDSFAALYVPEND